MEKIKNAAANQVTRFSNGQKQALLSDLRKIPAKNKFFIGKIAVINGSICESYVEHKGIYHEAPFSILLESGNFCVLQLATHLFRFKNNLLSYLGEFSSMMMPDILSTNCGIFQIFEQDAVWIANPLSVTKKSDDIIEVFDMTRNSLCAGQFEDEAHIWVYQRDETGFFVRKNYQCVTNTACYIG